MGHYPDSITFNESQSPSDGNYTFRYEGSSGSVWFSLIPIACVIYAAGAAADIGHINTKSKVTGHQLADDGLRHALTGPSIA